MSLGSPADHTEDLMGGRQGWGSYHQKRLIGYVADHEPRRGMVGPTTGRCGRLVQWRSEQFVVSRVLKPKTSARSAFAGDSRRSKSKPRALDDHCRSRNRKAVARGTEAARNLAFTPCQSPKTAVWCPRKLTLAPRVFNLLALRRADPPRTRLALTE